MQTSPFIEAALTQAELALKKGEIPIGAVLVDSKTNKIVAKSHNKTETENFTSHAELNVIQEFTKKHKIARLDDYDLYVTLEPCTMCTAAISLSRIRRLYFCTESPKFGAIISNQNYFTQPQCHHKPEYYHGFQEERSQKLLKEFFNCNNI